MAEYRYTACGLPNVIVDGIERRVDEDGDEIVSIPNVNSLHRVIAAALIEKPSALTGAEMRFLRAEMGLTQAELGQALHREALTVGRWERGDNEMEPMADSLIRLLAAEKLKLGGRGASAWDVVGRATPRTAAHPIRIDGSDPTNYRVAA